MEMYRPGDLGQMVDPMSTPIWQIARKMRLRPETVMKKLSEAFDRSLREHTLKEDRGELHFEADMAWITLMPLEGKPVPWALKYRAKEGMFNHDTAPHPMSMFSVPEYLENNVSFPKKILGQLREELGEADDTSNMTLMERMSEAYRQAIKTGSWKMHGEAVVFDTDLRTKDGSCIRGTIIPDRFDPIPNTWQLIALECVEE